MKCHQTLLLLILCCQLVYAANQSDLEKLLALKKSSTAALDLSKTDLRSYLFISGKIDLRNANFSHSNLSGVDLSKFDLSGANFSDADLSRAKLDGANLSGSNLTRANLTNAELENSNLSGANLSFAVLTGANLRQVVLSKANLHCALLDQADLTHSNFTEATISGASFTNTIANDVIGYSSVIDEKINCIA